MIFNTKRNKNHWIRVFAGILAAAVIASDGSVAVLAADTPEPGSEQAAYYGTVPEDTYESGRELPEEEDPAEDVPEESDALTDETAADETEEPVEVAGETEDIGASYVSGTPEGDGEEEGEPILIATVVIDEAHGEPGRIISNSFDSFNNKSRSYHFHDYSDQLKTYGRKIYDFLDDHSDDFITESRHIIDPTEPGADIPMLVLEEDIPGSKITSKGKDAKDQVYLAYAAFDFDHPEVFWLDANSFRFNIYKMATGDDTYKVMVEFAHAEDRNYTAYGDTLADLDVINTDKVLVRGNTNTIKALADAQPTLYGKVTVINDWLSNNNYYNRQAKADRNKKAYKASSALSDQTWLTSADDPGDPDAPVCEGYSRAFKIVCDRIGIPCILAIGQGHMWNYVQNIDGVWYAVDVTWDDPERDDEWEDPTTPADLIDKYVMVGNQTVVPGETKTFLADGHNPNGTFWSDGIVMATPEISKTAYEEDLGPNISDLDIVTGNGTMTVSFRTDKPGRYFYVMIEDGDTVPDVYDIQHGVTEVENGAGNGSVSAADAAAGEIEFEITSPPGGKKYDFYLIQLTAEEYISSSILKMDDVVPGAYVGWKEVKVGRTTVKYYFCPEDYEGWEENIEGGVHKNERGAMATGAVWIADDDEADPTMYLYKFRQDGTLEKQWYRIKYFDVKDIPADAPGAVAVNKLQRGSSYKLEYEYIPESDDEHALELLNDDKRVRWTSSRPDIVSVDSDGVVHALQVSPGLVTITGWTGDEDNRYHPTDVINITVTDPVGWFGVNGNRFYGEVTGGTVTRAEDWREIDGKHYYFYHSDDPDHTPYSVATGYAKIGGRYYQFDSDGARIGDDTGMSDGFLTLGGKTYYIEDGIPVTGENRKIGVHWYGFDDDGVMFENGYFKRVIAGNEEIFYADEDGVLAEGPRYVDLVGNRYFADDDFAAENGVPECSMREGILALPSGYYYYGKIEATVISGDRVKVDGGTRQYGYFAGDDLNPGKNYYAAAYSDADSGQLQSGWVQIGGVWKLFRDATDPTSPFAETDNAYLEGWVEVDEPGDYGRYYFNAGGKLLTGWQTINGNKYYFYADGRAASGMTEIAGNVYYFGENADFGNPNDDYGIMKTGRVTVPPYTYFFSTAGIRLGGWQKDPVTQIWDLYDPATFRSAVAVNDTPPSADLAPQNWYKVTVGVDEFYYYFPNNSAPAKGFQTIGGNKYWFDTAGGDSAGRMATGLCIIGTNRYFFGINAADVGKMFTGLKTFVSELDGETYTYYANASGILQTGWQKIDGRWRYFDRELGYETNAAVGADYWSEAKGNDGIDYKYYFRNGTTMVTGLQLIDGKYYYFSENKEDGSLGRLIISGYVTSGGNLYVADAHGILEQIVRGSAGVDEDGWLDLGGGAYKHIAENNKLHTGWQTINGNRYRFDDEGNLMTGEFTVGADLFRTHVENAGYEKGICYANEWYSYYDPADPPAATRFQYHDANGVRKTGWQTVWENGAKQYCYLSPEDSADGRYSVGDMYTGPGYIAGVRYVFDGRGLNPRSATIALEEDPVSRISAEMEGTYCTNANGIVLTGWQKIEGVWRYFDPATGIETASAAAGEGFMTVGADTYYFADGAKMLTGFKDIDGKRYFFNNDATDAANYGKMAKGWFVSGGNKYYADPADGHLLSGVMAIGGETYDFDKKCILLTGWQMTDANATVRRFFDNTKDIDDPLYGAMLPPDEDHNYVGNGFYAVTIDGTDRYYRFISGKMQTGWQTIDGGRYCFGDDGQLLTGLFCYKNAWYYTSETGAAGAGLGRAVSGFATVVSGGKARKYYLDQNGKVQTGWQTVNGKTYYLDPTQGENFGAMMFGIIRIGKQAYYTGPDGVRHTGRFINYCGETYYAASSGVLQTGWQTIKYTQDNISRKYYFDTEGRMQTGWQLIGKDRYFFDTADELPQKGSLLTGNMLIDGETYSFNNNGVLQTGWQKIDGVWCYFGTEADAEKGTIADAEIGKRFYLEAALPADYWRTVDFAPGVSRLYYISGNSTVSKGWTSVKDALGVTRKYYFDTVTGELLTGLYRISGAYYLLPDKGENIEDMAGRQTIGADRYFFDAKGKALTGWQTDADEKIYYYRPEDCREDNGEVIDYVGENIYAIKTGSAWYRLHADGSRFGAAFANHYLSDAGGKLLGGWQTAGGIKRYFDPAEYYMHCDGSSLIGGKWYCFDDEGVIRTGFFDDPFDGFTYYYNSSGIRQSGWLKLDGDRYYLDPGAGAKDPATGRVKKGFADIGTGRYHFDETTGVMSTGLTPIGGDEYYFSETGIMQTGWQKIGNVWKYFATAADAALGRVDADKIGKKCPDTASLPGAFGRKVTYDAPIDVVFCINNNTTLLKGWQTIDGKKYYFNTSGELQTGDFAINNARYHANADGSVYSGFLEEADGWHYFDASGKMLTGWQNIKGNDNVTRKCYLNANGVLYIGKMSINGSYYFFDDDPTHDPGDGDQGKMLTGEAVSSIDGSEYLANNSGVLQTGWQKVGGNWDYYATQQDIDNGLTDAGDFGKRYYHETSAPADFWRNVAFDHGDRYYYIYNNTTVYKGWKDVKNALLNTVIKYYFDPVTGELWTGKRKIGNVYYDLPEKDEVLATGLQNIGGKWYFISDKGQVMTGWQTVDGDKYYFDPATGVMQTGFVLVGSGWYYLDPATGVMQTGLQTIGGYDHLFDGNGKMMTGWQAVGGGKYYFDPGTGRKQTGCFVTVGSAVYYADATGTMHTGWLDIAPYRYYLNDKGVLQTLWQKIGNDTYYFDPATGRMATGFITVGTGRYCLDADGKRLTGLKVVGGETYYFSGTGIMQTGWQTADGGKRYFDPITGKMATGFLNIDNNRYYLDETGVMATGLTPGIGGESYYFAKTGIMQTGWQKIENVWYYFATDEDVSIGRVDDGKRGKLCLNAQTPGSYWWTVTFDNPALDPETAVFYINNNTTVLKGWQKIGDELYYFSPAGELTYGHFTVNGEWYYANEAGLYPGSIFKGFRNDGVDVYYYNASGKMLTGWQDIKDGAATGRYYFDIDGRMQKGVTDVGGKKYLLNDDPVLAIVGTLLKNGYFLMSGEHYLTAVSGEIRTGWYKFTVDDTTKIRYFAPGSGHQLYEIDLDPDTGWYDAGTGRIYVEKGTVVTGWKMIGNKKYYFDTTTGALATGRYVINGVQYYFGDDGTLASGVVNENGFYYYIKPDGTVRVGWITDGTKKYYADPETSRLCTGFATINGYNYYFNEEASEPGEMLTGFFRVPDLGQGYYDSTPNASNMYYAFPDGKIHTGGWDTFVLNKAVSDSQRWSYYFAENIVGTTPEGFAITGEVATGDVEIDDDGIVTWHGNVADMSTHMPALNAARYYRFDPETGARRKAVLVFLGNYYGEADYEYDEEAEVVKSVTARFSQSQFAVMDSFSKYINPDRAFANIPEDYFIVNSNRFADQTKLYDAGLTDRDPAAKQTFPMAASIKQPITPGDHEKYCYVVTNDIAAAGGVPGPDGHVDVYDVEMYSTDVYNNAMDKFGPNNVVLIGISSGGGICLSLCQNAPADRQPANTILFSPWVNLNMNKAEIERKIPRDKSEFLDVDTARYWAARYTRDFTDPDLYSLPDAADEGPGVLYPFASPLYGNHFDRLRNVVIYTGSYDPFSLDCKSFADKAADEGGDVTLKNYSSMIHAYMFNRSWLPQSGETINKAAWAIMTQTED